MNVILFHTSSDIPSHLEFCINQIKYFTPNVKIFFITDRHFSFEGVETVNVNDLLKDRKFILDTLPYYKHDSSPLWRTSALRFYYIYELMVRNNLENVFHFDNDVLIYEDLNTVFKKLNQSDNFKITRHKNEEAVCGFVYIRNASHLNYICEELFRFMKDTEQTLEFMLKSMPHEMRLLGEIFNTTNLIQDFPILPNWTGFGDHNSVYDPSSYGQYICYNKFIHEGSKNRFIDKQILNNKITIEFDNNLKLPFVNYNGNKTKINNLHIHCKNLQDYISYK